jgi:tetrahydromethanopterin S-methyltransferase subunit D
MKGFSPTAESHGFRPVPIFVFGIVVGVTVGMSRNRYIFHSLASCTHSHYPIVHELLKHQSHYHHRVLTAYKISGYPLHQIKNQLMF